MQCRFRMESTLYVFLPGGVFLPWGHGLDFGISLLSENSIKITKKKSRRALILFVRVCTLL